MLVKKNGDKDAMFRYAVLLSEGDLIEKNDEEAIKFKKDKHQQCFIMHVY